ncbi:hypothetical protein FKW77_002128 [Venturia effusa]|uniref:Cytochrome P450 monooxygenase n=1 Tax=Venturia effusa TaxID=50376 RepID=A0A517LC10_9PEZI|nr:hypothetical protein FKW77_002128 [Venturia effusa]
MVEIETKSLLASLNKPESLMGVLLLAGALLLFRFTLFDQDLSHIPLLDAHLPRAERWKAFVQNQKGVLEKGYKNFRCVFRMDTPEGPMVVVPPHMMDEMKNINEENMDNISALSDMTESKLTGITSTTPMMNHLVKGDLTASLSTAHHDARLKFSLTPPDRINPRLAKTAEEAVATEIPNCPEWTKVPFFQCLLNIVAIVSGDIFLGPEMCRNEEYMKLSVGYTLDAFAGIHKLKQWRKWMRPIGRYFVPELKVANAYRSRSNKFLGPLIKQRRAMIEQGADLPDDLLSWTMRKTSKFPEEIKSDDDIAFMQLRLSLAAIHTTSNTGGILMRDIVTQPGLVQALRAEIEEVLARHNGVFSTKALYEMRLLDSAMKESQRMHMLGPMMYHNKTRRGITLSDGTYIPPNTTITGASLASAMDPSKWPNPETYDPYRFLKMRQASDEDAGKHQFVTLNKDMVTFGYGKHACPGRFFAANEIKIIFINILRRFDIETREGEVDFMGQPELFLRNMRA